MKLRRRPILPSLFLLILILASCNLFNPEPDYTIRGDDEYELYNYIISRYSTIHDLELFHIYLETTKSTILRHPDSSSGGWIDLSYFGEPYDSMIAIDYLSRNDTIHYLDETYLDTPALGISSEEFQVYCEHDSIFDPYAAYRMDYPNSGGIIYFKRPGFDESRTRAILYYTRMYGMLGGQGEVSVFEKTDGSWEKKATFVNIQY